MEARYTPSDPGQKNVGLSMVTSTGNDPLSPIAAQIEKDAATNGLSAWGYSFLRQLGRTIKPEWLKENSKEWFNKPLIDPSVPPKGDFVKYVEPATRRGWTGGSEFLTTDRGINSLRAKYGLPVDSIWKGREYIFTETPVTYAGTPEEQIQQFDAARSAFEKENPRPPMGTPLGEYEAKWRDFQRKWKPGDTQPGDAPRNPIEAGNMPGAGGTGLAGPNPNAAADAAALAARQWAFDNDPATLAARDRYSYTDEAGRRAAMANFRADHTWNAADAIRDRNTPGASPKTLLPPYLQPGGGNNIAGGVQGVLNRYNTGVLPPQQTVNPLAPLMPVNPLMPAVGQIPLGMPTGSPFPTGTNLGVGGINTGGGFGATAKLLELPFYLRNFGKPRRGIYG